VRHWYRKLSGIVRELSRLHIAVYSGNATFFILLSLFPASIVLLTVIQYLPATVSDLEVLISSMTPGPVQELVSQVFQGLSPSGSAVVLSAAAIGTIWSVTRGMVSLTNGLDVVYRAPRERPLVQKALISFGGFLLLSLCIIATLLLQVFGTGLLDAAVEQDEFLTALLFTLLRLRWLFTVAFLTLVFCLLYTVLPCRRMRFSQNLPGALFATLGWHIYSVLYGFYVENFSSYANIYGSLTAVIITMLWLYFCINLIFYGGLLNYILAEVPHPIRQLRRYFRG